jgi:hypothetical protein
MLVVFLVSQKRITTTTTRMATAMTATTTRTTMASRICMLSCVWLGIVCMTTLAEALRTGGGSVGRGRTTRYGGGGAGSGVGTGYTTSTTSFGSDYGSLGNTGIGSDYGSVSNNAAGYYGGDGTTTYTSTSQGVGAGVGTGGRGGGSGFSLFFGSRQRTTNNNGDNYNDQQMPVIFIVLFWLMVATVALTCCYCCANSNRRDNPEYPKTSFASHVANAKAQVKRHGAAKNPNKSAGGGATDDDDDNKNNTSRPPADGSYVATYTIQGRAVSTTMNLYFSPNKQDSRHTSWCIMGRGKCTKDPMTTGGHDDEADAVGHEFKITEGVMAESGHAYWVQQKLDTASSSSSSSNNNNRSLTTGKFEFDTAGDHPVVEERGVTGATTWWCSFTGSILTPDGNQAAYTSLRSLSPNQ